MRLSRFSKLLPLFAALGFGMLMPAAASAATILGQTSDNELNEDGSVGAVANATVRAGASSSAPVGGRNAFLVFQLPNLGAVSDPFASSSLSPF